MAFRCSIAPVSRLSKIHIAVDDTRSDNLRIKLITLPELDFDKQNN